MSKLVGVRLLKIQLKDLLENFKAEGKTPVGLNVQLPSPNLVRGGFAVEIVAVGTGTYKDRLTVKPQRGSELMVHVVDYVYVDLVELLELFTGEEWRVA